MKFLSSFAMAILAQAAPGFAQENAEGAEEAIKDAPGQIDLSIGTIWETVDNLIDGFLSRLPFILLGILVFGTSWLVASWTRRIIRRAMEGRGKENLGLAIARIAQWVILFVGVLLAVMIIAPSVTPGRLLASLGVGGIAIGFAFKDILQNFLAGLLILLREPFRIGDQIVSGEFEGTVESIETRATMIKTYDGRRVVIPNSQIYTNPVIVNTAYEARRSQYDVGIGYGDDFNEASRVILDAMKSVEGVLSEPAPDVLVMELADSTVNLRARWWTAPDRATVVRTHHAVVSAIKQGLDQAAIDMPFPTQVVLFHDQTEETDGDRTRQREGWPAGSNPPQARTIAGALVQSKSG